MITDPYSVLGVSEKTSDADLKKAYRELSKKWHPDANPGNTEAAEERFKEIQEAYRQIVDARARGTSAYGPSSSSGPQTSYYDYREANPYGNASGNTQYSSHWTYADPSDFEDFFRENAVYSLPATIVPWHHFPVVGQGDVADDADRKILIRFDEVI